MAEIDIILDGEKMQLMPSLNAARELCRKYGGLLVLVDLINTAHFNAMVDVVWYGLGSGSDMDRKELEPKVYASGLSKLAPRLVRYVILLVNGGNEPEEVRADGLAVQLQSSIVTRLRQTSAVTDFVPADNIFDRSQRPERDVCIVVGEDQILDEPHSLADDSLRAYLTLHVWHLSQNFTTVKNIADGIRIAVRDRFKIKVPSATVVRLKFQSARFMRDPGGNYIHGVITLNALLQLDMPDDFDNEFSEDFN
jgi:Protein of unknown function (DUF3168)